MQRVCAQCMLSKVIQGQSSWCQLTACGRLPIRLLLTSTSFLSPFLNIWRVI